MFGTKKRVTLMIRLAGMLPDGRRFETRFVESVLDADAIEAAGRPGRIAPPIANQGRFRVANYTPGPIEPCDLRKHASVGSQWVRAEQVTAEGLAFVEAMLAKLHAGEPLECSIDGVAGPMMIDPELINPSLTLLISAS